MIAHGGRLPALAAVLVLLAGGLIQIAFGYSHREDLTGDAWGSDDAYISYRYARNLAAGEGLVFNPGERVEGISNLLYTLLLAPAAAAVPAARLYFVSAGLNLLLALLALALFHRFARRRLGGRAGGIAAVLFALCPSLWVAVASGLETPLVLLIQIALWVLVERWVADEKAESLGLLGLVAVLSVLARADGFVMPLLAAGFLVLRGRWRAAFAVAGAALGTFGALALWRLSYYGWPLPNTYYAKMTGTLAARLQAGGQQLITILLGTGLLVHAAAFAASAVRGLRSRSAPPFPAVFAAGWLAYFLYVGGDVFYDRFLLVLFPMGIYLLLGLAAETGRRGTVTAMALLLGALQLVPLVTDPRCRYRSEKYDRWVMLGRFLGREHPGALLAIDGVGKVPFFSGLRTIDMLGLTDAHIAHGQADDRDYFWVGHAKSDLPYVLSRRPDLIASWLGGAAWSLRPGPVPEPEGMARAGYRLIYLVNTEAGPKPRNLRDVRGAGAGEVRRLYLEGYRYGVFARP